MTIPSENFSVYDVSAFPIVLSKNEAMVPGYAGQWEKEITSLLQYGKPFVLVFLPPRDEETLADRKHRGIWLQQNRQELAQICRALISVEPDPHERMLAKVQSEVVGKALGIPLEAVATFEEAVSVGKKLIAEAM